MTTTRGATTLSQNAATHCNITTRPPTTLLEHKNRRQTRLGNACWWPHTLHSAPTTPSSAISHPPFGREGRAGTATLRRGRPLCTSAHRACSNPRQSVSPEKRNSSKIRADSRHSGRQGPQTQGRRRFSPKWARTVQEDSGLRI